jgi:hypothetical protein
MQSVRTKMRVVLITEHCRKLLQLSLVASFWARYLLRLRDRKFQCEMSEGFRT